MILLNINQKIKPLIEDYISILEEKYSPLEFVFVYGYNNVVQYEYIREQVKVKVDVEKIPVIVMVNGITEESTISSPEYKFCSLDKEDIINDNLVLVTKGGPKYHYNAIRAYLPSNVEVGFSYESDHLDKGFLIFLGWDFLKHIGESSKHPGILSYILDNLLYESNAFHNIDTDPPTPYPYEKKVADFKASSVDLNNAIHEDNRRRVLELTSKINEATSALHDLIKNRNARLSIIDEERRGEYINKQLNIINSRKDVLWVAIKGSKIMVMLEHIKIHVPEFNAPDESFNIGNIILEIDMKEGIVNFNNVSRRVHGYAADCSHPHDLGGGTMCFGDIGEFIPEIINTAEISVLVELLSNFAKQVNIDDLAGKTIEAWPIVKS